MNRCWILYSNDAEYGCLSVVLSSYVYLLYYVCIVVFFFTLDAGPLARSQHSEGPATDHLDAGFY